MNKQIDFAKYFDFTKIFAKFEYSQSHVLLLTRCQCKVDYANTVSV